MMTEIDRTERKRKRDRGREWGQQIVDIVLIDFERCSAVCAGEQSSKCHGFYIEKCSWLLMMCQFICKIPIKLITPNRPHIKRRHSVPSATNIFATLGHLLNSMNVMPWFTWIPDSDWDKSRISDRRIRHTYWFIAEKKRSLTITSTVGLENTNISINKKQEAIIRSETLTAIMTWPCTVQSFHVICEQHAE